MPSVDSGMSIRSQTLFTITEERDVHPLIKVTILHYHTQDGGLRSER
jgi:hypothetical protein